MLDNRYLIRLTDEVIRDFDGVSGTGSTGKTYRPQPLDNFSEGAICFCTVRTGKALARILDQPVVDAALIVSDQAVKTLDPKQLEAFAERNVLLICAAPPKVVFGMLLEQQGPRDKGQLLRLTDGHTNGGVKGCKIAADVLIAGNAQIGEGSILASGAVVGDDVVIGNNCILAEGAKIYHGVTLGNDVHVGSGSLIGSPVYANEQVGGTRAFVDMPQIGGLSIGDNVRIGAQSVVNRGTLSDTVLGEQIRIGDRVNIGHNANIGDRVWIAASSIVCGSSTVGDNVSIGIGVVIKNKMKIGAGAMVGAGSVIISNVPKGDKTYPIPALGERALLRLIRMVRKTNKR